MLTARKFYATRTEAEEGRLFNFLLSGWQADRLVELMVLKPFRAVCRFSCYGIDLTVIDGILECLASLSQRLGERLRLLSTGRLSTYIGGFAWGLLALLGWTLWRLVSL